MRCAQIGWRRYGERLIAAPVLTPLAPAETGTGHREFALLARTTAGRSDVDAVDSTALEAVDWPRYLSLVERHRVAPLAFDRLTCIASDVPSGPLADLRGMAMRDRTGGLRLISALIHAHHVLADAGIDAVSVKGPALAKLAFGDVTMRQSRDIDLLIATDDVAAAIAVLEGNGFRLIHPRLDTPDRLRVWTRLMKDAALVHDASDTLLELHWRLSQNRYLLPPALTRSRQLVAVGPALLPTLGQDDLLLYLCVHGARHFWARLKWLADVHALLGDDAAAADRFYRHARAVGLDIPAGLMLVLIETVYGTVAPANVRSWRVRWLHWIALKCLHAADEKSVTIALSTLCTLGSLLLRRDIRYVASDLASLLIDQPTALKLGGSRWACAVAVIGRPVFWAARKTRLIAAALRRQWYPSPTLPRNTQ